MNSKQKIRNVLATAVAVMGLGAGAYSAFVLSGDAVSREYAVQEHAVRLMISETQRLQAGLERELEKSAVKTVETYAALREHARTLERGGVDPALSPLSFFGFDYFASKNERAAQLFYSEDDFPEGKACPTVLHVPESLTSAFTGLLGRQHVQSERFRCYEKDGAGFMGYLLNSAAGRKVNYMYVMRLGEENLFKMPSPPLSERLAQAFDNKSDGLTRAVVNKGLTLYATDKFEPLKLDVAIFKSDRTQESVELPGGNYLMSAVTLGSLTAIAASPKGAAVTGSYVFGGVLAAFGIIFALMLVNFGRQDDRRERDEAAERRRLIETLTGHNLLNAESAANMRRELEEFTQEDCAEAAKLLNSVSQSITDGVAEINKDHRREIDELSDEKFEEGCKRQLAKLQQSLIPTANDLPSSRFLDIASYLMPAADGCTDSYDIFRVDNDNICFVIGTATQRGTPMLKQFGQLLPMLRSMVRDQGRDLDDSFNVLNRLMLERNHNGIGIRLFAMILSEFTGNYVCCDSGFPAPLLSSLSGVTPIEMAQGRPLGINPEEKYFKVKGKLPFGDSILVGSQGYIDFENENGEKFGVERVKDALKTQYEQSAIKMLVKVSQDQSAFGSMKNRREDHCVICVKKTNNAQPRE